MMENQDSPPLHPSLAPLLLFQPGHGGCADQAEEETTDDNGGTRFLYSIPKRQLFVVSGFDYLNIATRWITPQGWVLVNRDTRCLLSTPQPDDDRGCVVLLIHLRDPVLWYCGLDDHGRRRWCRHEYSPETISTDNPSYVTYAMRRLVAMRGKFYTIFQAEKLVALEFSPGPVFSTTRAVITPWLSGFYRTGLVESRGDLFAVRLNLEPSRRIGIIDIFVYKLVSSKNAWVKVAGLGDNRVFFFGRDMDQFGVSMAADELGFKGNCIYFTRYKDKGLYVYDLEQGATTVHNPGPDVPDSTGGLLLMRVA
ncbi:hypothetical protein BS78_02G172700 [Paspalum vaginatum]|nr:hypothetical protein BS78_02G172700 [Paspalum vaginatum]